MMMKKKFLSLLIANVLYLPVVVDADVEIVTDHAVVRENDTLEARLRFPGADQGDLYVAARIGGKLRFFGEDGKFHSVPVPYKQDGSFDQEETIFRFPGMIVPAGRYILYAAVTDAGADVYDTSRWHGPLARQLFIANEPDHMSGDHDGDGWPDDDTNHDGFSDMDHNYDGWRDDDGNHDGVPDQYENSEGGQGNNQSADDSREGADGQDDDNSGNDNGNSGSSGSSPTTDDATTQGGALYRQKCAGCHGSDPIDNRNKIQRGSNTSRINTAISTNRGGMGYLANQLTTSDIDAIAAYIRSRSGG